MSSNIGGLDNTNPNQSYEVEQPPTDSVTSLCFSPTCNYMVATTWNNEVRCWEIRKGFGGSIRSMPKAGIKHEKPVLCSAWKGDGKTIFSGGCSNEVKMWQLGSGRSEPLTVAEHGGPIKEVAWIPEIDILTTASWDKTLRYWDLRQKAPLHTQQLPDRCDSLSVKYPLMVVGTADKNLIVYDLNKPWEEFKRIPLKYQTRCVAAFPDHQGFLVGAIGGSVGVFYLDDAQQAKNYTFSCHREGREVYSVNSLNFHPVHHTFATTGSDGAVNFWDKDSKLRLKAMSRCNNPIPCSAFNSDGSIYAYAVCYDWSKGPENHNPSTAKSTIFLHLPQKLEVRGKPRVGTGW